MTDISEFWAKDDVYARIVAALERVGKDLQALSAADLAPLDHYHAGGLASTVALADALPVQPGQRLIDIGCGIGGPARYFAGRFNCRVEGVDIAAPFIDAARRLTALVRMDDQARFTLSDGLHLPFADASFDGAYCQHVTMNVEDRGAFFAEAARVLKPGGFLAVTEHGLGPVGDPHYPAPWSDDGRFSFLATPARSRDLLERAGFEVVTSEETGEAYLAAYRRQLALAAEGKLPVLGVHVLVGPRGPERTRNAARNIEEGRTAPVRFICAKR